MNSLSCQPPASKLAVSPREKGPAHSGLRPSPLAHSPSEAGPQGGGADTAPKLREQKETKPNTEPPGKREGDSTKEEESSGQNLACAQSSFLPQRIGNICLESQACHNKGKKEDIHLYPAPRWGRPIQEMHSVLPGGGMTSHCKQIYGTQALSVDRQSRRTAGHMGASLHTCTHAWVPQAHLPFPRTREAH